MQKTHSVETSLWTTESLFDFPIFFYHTCLNKLNNYCGKYYIIWLDVLYCKFLTWISCKHSVSQSKIHAKGKEKYEPPQ